MSFGEVTAKIQLLWDHSNKLQVPGIILFRNPATSFVSVRHWLVVTFFTVFYGVLKWVYRKRGKAVADE